MNRTKNTGTSMEAASEMLHVIERLQASRSRAVLPPNNLAIDFAQKSPLGERALRLTARKGAETLGVMCEPEDVLERIGDMCRRTPAALRDVGIVLVNYVLHDVPAQARPAFLLSLKDTMPNALFIVADYTMLDLPAEQAATLSTSVIERSRMAQKTPPVYLAEHLQFTHKGLCELMGRTHGYVRSHALPAARALVSGGSSLAWTPDLEQDWAEEGLQTAENPMPAVRQYVDDTRSSMVISS